MLHSHRWRSSSERLVSLLAAMTTTPPPIPARGGGNTKPEVSVVVTPGATTASSVSFTVAPQNADKCAYVCLKNVEGIELPDAVSVMAEGRQLEKVETQLVESIKANGVLTPAVLRQKEDGRYEIVSGHRRKRDS